MDDAEQQLPYQELWNRLKRVIGERDRLEAKLAALKSEPEPLSPEADAPSVLAVVEGYWSPGVAGLGPVLFVQKWPFIFSEAPVHEFCAPVTVTITERVDKER